MHNHPRPGAVVYPRVCPIAIRQTGSRGLEAGAWLVEGVPVLMVGCQGLAYYVARSPERRHVLVGLAGETGLFYGFEERGCDPGVHVCISYFYNELT